MKVSVALCTYNGARHLETQLESIAGQTHPPDEVSVLDDGSSDLTHEMLREYSRASSLRVLVDANRVRLGPAKNFEAAIGRCTGDLILLADQDDIWEPQRVKVMSDLFRRDPNLWAAFSNGEILGARGRGDLWGRIGFSRGDLSGGDWSLFKRLLRGNVAVGATVALRGSAVPFLLPIGAGWMHDYWIAMLAASAGRLGITSERLVRYRLHDGNVLGFKGEDLRSRVVDRTDRFTRVSRAWRTLAVRVGDLLLSAQRRADWDAECARELVLRRALFFEERAVVCGKGLRERARFAMSRYLSGDYDVFCAGLRSASLDVMGVQLRRVLGRV